MPTYDYRCEANGKVVEVKHGMQEVINTWGELCGRLGIGPGDTAPDAPVAKLANGGQVVKSGSLGESKHACGGGGCGMCALN